MPTPDLIQGVPLPTYDDPAAIPDDLANVFYANLSRGIPRFSTTAQRDAAYPSPIDGQHAWITAENAVYVRSGGAWRVLWRAGFAPLIQHGQVTIDVSGLAANEYKTAPVTFAAAFASRPSVFAGAQETTRPFALTSQSVTASSFMFGVRNIAATPIPAGVIIIFRWLAVAS